MDMGAAGGKAGPKPDVSFKRNVVSPYPRLLRQANREES
jgi:hypothetical protein